MPAQLLVPDRPGPDGLFRVHDARSGQVVDQTGFRTHEEAVQHGQRLAEQSYREQPELGGLAQPDPGVIYPERPRPGMRGVSGPMP